MTDVEQIRLAEQRVENVQRVLGAVQTGLRTAEDVTVAVERARRPLRRVLVAVVVVVGIAAVVTLVTRSRSQGAQSTDDPAS
jgi:hypothetical protein